MPTRSHSSILVILCSNPRRTISAPLVLQVPMQDSDQYKRPREGDTIACSTEEVCDSKPFKAADGDEAPHAEPLLKCAKGLVSSISLFAGDAMGHPNNYDIQATSFPTEVGTANAANLPSPDVSIYSSSNSTPKILLH